MIRDLDGSGKVCHTRLYACSTMSEDQLKAFLSALNADIGLQDKLKAAVEAEIDTVDETAAVLAIAKEAGFAFTAAELLRYQAQIILELTDDELDSIAGGYLNQAVGYTNCMENTNRSSMSFGSSCRDGWVTRHYENAGRRYRNG